MEALKRLYEARIRAHSSDPNWRYPTDTGAEEEGTSIGGEAVGEDEAEALAWLAENGRMSYILRFMDLRGPSRIRRLEPGRAALSFGDSNFYVDVPLRIVAFAAMLSNTHHLARGIMQIPTTLFVVSNEGRAMEDVQRDSTIQQSYGRACYIVIYSGILHVQWMVKSTINPEETPLWGDEDSVKMDENERGVAVLMMRTLMQSLMDNRRLELSISADPPEVARPPGAPSVGSPRLMRALILAGSSPWFSPYDTRNDPVIPMRPIDKEVLITVNRLINPPTEE